MSEIKWQEPPAGKTERGHWDEVAAQLRERPGAWALVSEQASSPSLASNIKAGGVAAFAPRGTFEARQRRVGDGFDIYARYVGKVTA